mmetsp:Transcript_33610/g.81300  ORF Transcript_33610/g.81300 Transcript_33610/m.81300 type:complete len:317 (+) Transcript_33610:1047-1997(+)
MNRLGDLDHLLLRDMNDAFHGDLNHLDPRYSAGDLLNLRNLHHLVHRLDVRDIHVLLPVLDLDLGDLPDDLLGDHLGDLLDDLLNLGDLTDMLLHLDIPRHFNLSVHPLDDLPGPLHNTLFHLHRIVREVLRSLNVHGAGHLANHLDRAVNHNRLLHHHRLLLHWGHIRYLRLHHRGPQVLPADRGQRVPLHRGQGRALDGEALHRARHVLLAPHHLLAPQVPLAARHPRAAGVGLALHVPAHDGGADTGAHHGGGRAGRADHHALGAGLAKINRGQQRHTPLGSTLPQGHRHPRHGWGSWYELSSHDGRRINFLV